MADSPTSQIKTPTDALALAQEILSTLMLEANNNEPTVGRGRRKLSSPRVEVLPPVSNYRQPLAERELEDGVINLYAKGLTGERPSEFGRKTVIYWDLTM